MPPRIFLGGGPPRKRLTSQSPSQSQSTSTPRVGGGGYGYGDADLRSPRELEHTTLVSKMWARDQ
ncbi:GM22944 [Drosophila sechellia]|uniref:GM22944 n=1 Tax=Drosophila sechellia TaxID=7238 RepID=B4I713_DROSE|nr:GM22944 [Drosophila sechellia]